MALYSAWLTIQTISLENICTNHSIVYSNYSIVPYYAPSGAFYSWNAITENTKVRHHLLDPHHLMTEEI